LETCLVISTGLVILFLINDWKPILIAGAAIGLTGIFLDKPASWISWLWFNMAELLGKIVPAVILTVVFFFILFPISLVSRVFRDNMPGIRDEKNVTLWIKRDFTFSKDDLKNPW
jgi:hypothetical protein